MYTYIGIALMSVFAMMVIPAQVETDSTSPLFYGIGSLTLLDAAGNEVFAQSIHNRLVNQGESFILDQVFEEGAASLIAENQQMGAICVSNFASFIDTQEGLDAATFDGEDSLTAANCVQDDAGGVDDSVQGTAVVNPPVFDTGNLDAPGETIFGIGICQNQSAGSADFANCASGGSGAGGQLFATINTSDITLLAGETVDISYTFDITTTGS